MKENSLILLYSSTFNSQLKLALLLSPISKIQFAFASASLNSNSILIEFPSKVNDLSNVPSIIKLNLKSVACNFDIASEF